ncbi:MAG: gliding motility-associated C-terminal domain-containing protein [Bacteroidetes bacterium]|nr:gliding motility-associated C-terminal domain-containing protein [Bacteroidota bacterium]
MRKVKSTFLKCFAIVFFLFIGKADKLFAQNTINAGPDDTICAPGCATLTATVSTTVGITGTALTLSDDWYSGVIPLGFNFTFFGNTYSQIVVGSNNMVTFDLAAANTYDPWPISAAIPTNADPMNSIMCPWEDLLPPAGGTEIYATIGTAPNRIFVVSYCSTPMYSCTNLLYTGSILLYETSNIIETHIANKYTCPWNGSYAIHGIQNSTGTTAFVVPGRNYPSVWTTSNEGYRFTPTGPNTYTIALIPYAPIILNSPATAVSWYNGNQLVGTGTTVSVCPTTTTQYVATLGSCAGAAYDTVNVVVNSLIVNAGVDDTICPGAPVQLNATSASSVTTWSWSPTTALSNPNIANPVASPTVTTTYTVTGTMGTCTSSDDVTIVVSNSMTYTSSQTNLTCNNNCNGTATINVTSANGPFTYLWSPSGGTGATASNLCAGTYTCNVSATSGCNATQTFTITQPSAVAAPATMTSVLCNGGSTGTASVVASGGTPGYTYQWAPSGGTGSTANNLNAGTYTCIITDANGCIGTSTINVTQPAPLSTVVTAAPPAACSGLPVTLTATTTGGTSAYTTTWSPGVLPSGTPITINPLATTTYTASIVDANGCTNSSTVLVTVSPPPTVAFTSDTNANCVPACINFSDASSIAPPFSLTGWSWSFGDGGASSSSAPNHCYISAGNYNVTLIVWSSAGCVDSLTLNNYISVKPNPVANFDWIPVPIMEEAPTAYFTDLSIGSINNWSWFFGDTASGTSTLQNPSYDFGYVGCRNVMLVVTTTDGCIDTTVQDVCVMPDPALYVPNAFTPNGDGHNDVFLPKSNWINPDHYRMMIFDRWGNLLFETTDINKGWDGKVQGHSDLCQEDTYVYKITATDTEGKQYRLIGGVSLIK